jgi:hypothetical protein
MADKSRVAAWRRDYEAAHRDEAFDDDAKRTVEVSSAPVRNDAGEIIGPVTASMDVTARAVAETALAAQFRLNKAISENATTALFIMDQRQHCGCATGAGTNTRAQGGPARGVRQSSVRRLRLQDRRDCRIAGSFPASQQSRTHPIKFLSQPDAN